MTAASAPRRDAADCALRKIFVRILPLLMLMYVVAYVDRINIGFAALAMNEDLGLTSAMFGFANTAFYLTYSLFEIPSNVIMERTCARLWLARILLTWGIASAATTAVVGPASLYVVRALVGLAEAGLLPGLILYLARWIPESHRAKATGLFLSALPIAIMIGSPISGLILQLHGFLGLAGWRWLFLLEALPAIALGCAVCFILPNQPDDATWLTEDEKKALRNSLEKPHATRVPRTDPVVLGAIWRTVRDWKVVSLGIVYFCVVATANTLGTWSAFIISDLLGGTDRYLLIGLMGAIPPMFAIAGIAYFSARSDRSGERVRLCQFLLVLASAGWLGMIFAESPLFGMAGLVVCYVGGFSALAIFWTAASEVLPQATRAIGIAAVSTMGTFASILSPTLVGILKGMTQSMNAGMWYAVTLLVLGTVSLAAVAASRRDARSIAAAGALRRTAQTDRMLGESRE